MPPDITTSMIGTRHPADVSFSAGRAAIATFSEVPPGLVGEFDPETDHEALVLGLRELLTDALGWLEHVWLGGTADFWRLDDLVLLSAAESTEGDEDAPTFMAISVLRECKILDAVGFEALPGRICRSHVQTY